MTRTRPRSVVAAAASALLLAALAGCGGSDDSTTVGTSTSSASASPNASASTTASEGADVSAADFVEKLTAAMKDQPSVHMSLGGGSGVTLDADVRYGADPAIRMETEIAGSKVAMIVVDGKLYLQQGGGAFTKVGKNDPTFGAYLDSLENLGPRASVDDLKKGITKVTEGGTTTVDGIELTRYDVTVDTAKAAGSFSQLAGAAGQIEKILTMGFLLDPDGLVREIQVTTAGQSISMKFTDWGKPVDIVAPSGAQLAPVS